MRDLKFRIWNKNAKDFVRGDKNLIAHFDLILFSYYSRSGGLENLDDYIVQQFTGLKDKNGVDIYEGDIVKINKLHYEVMWVEYKWIATCPNYRRYNWPTLEHFNEVRCGEVAGNIFENKDLLK